MKSSFAQHILRLPSETEFTQFRTVSTVAEIQAALEKLTEEEQRVVAAWLEAKLWPETAAMLAAIDEGERSLREEPTVSVEELRRKIKDWAQK